MAQVVNSSVRLTADYILSTAKAQESSISFIICRTYFFR